jgi:AcrR family transcriptional regulator
MAQPETGRGRGRPPAGEGIDADALLEAALRAFALKGFDGFSIRELSRELGVSHALLNARFGSKQDLWFAAMSHVLADLDRDLREVGMSSGTGDDLQALREGIVRHVTFAAMHPEVQRIMSHEGAIDSDRIRFIVERFVAPLKAVIEQKLHVLAEAGRIRPTPYATFHYLITHGGGGLFASTVEARLLGADPPQGAAEIRRHAEQVADIIIQGITADTESAAVQAAGSP